ncbi:hypothetical protein PAQ31011_00610 [Pandoraea aquatica]|uniref:Uncharacterized protein n=1 Tax=Pandoraea aquatica TaxID=2508290 RepID=A0A5E4S742_9BURK|nr:hypothetical protein PAQ31011_00610 [Pandoraea aquatica]
MKSKKEDKEDNRDAATWGGRHEAIVILATRDDNPSQN